MFTCPDFIHYITLHYVTLEYFIYICCHCWWWNAYTHIGWWYYMTHIARATITLIYFVGFIEILWLLIKHKHTTIARENALCLKKIRLEINPHLTMTRAASSSASVASSNESNSNESNSIVFSLHIKVYDQLIEPLYSWNFWKTTPAWIWKIKKIRYSAVINAFPNRCPFNYSS